MKTIKNRKSEHFIYENMDEFRLYHDEPVIEPWQDGNEGDWVKADDGGIVQLLKKYNGKYQFIVRTAVGVFDSRYPMDTDVDFPRSRYSLSSRDRRTKYSRIKKKFTFRERMFYFFVALGDSPENAFKRAYPNVTYKQYKTERIYDLLNNENGQEMISKYVKEAAKEAGVSLVDVMKRIDKRAQQEKDIKTAQKADETLGKWLGAEESSTPTAPYMIMGQQIVQELEDEQSPKVIEGASEEQIHGGVADKLLQGESKQQGTSETGEESQ